jgi:hypothetical protein
MPPNDILDPQILAGDLRLIREAYADLFASLDQEALSRTGRSDRGGWTMREVAAHLGALNGAGIESIRHTLRGESYRFEGLDDRYRFDAYNRTGIDRSLAAGTAWALDSAVAVLDDGERIARGLTSVQAATTAPLPIYNRRVRVDETLSIEALHSGLLHSAQIADPAGVPPLWTRFDEAVQHRLASRLMLAFSLLYRVDLADGLRDTVAFRVGGAGGGEWYLDLRPDGADWHEAPLARPGLSIRMRSTATLFRMATHRIRMPVALATGEVRVGGHHRLFTSLGRLTSVDARPRHATSRGSPASSTRSKATRP